jgi:site-specific DNA-methyltransferase (adenine-specific)
MLKPYYQDAQVTLYHADCRSVLPELSPVDVVITSPPYNLGAAPWAHLGHWRQSGSAGGKKKWPGGVSASGGAQYGQHKDAVPWPEYVTWQRELLALLWSKLTDNGAIFYNHKPRVIGTKLWTPLELIPEDAELRQILTWARPGGMNFNATAFVPTYEWILLLAKPEFRLRSKGASGLGDVWQMVPDRNPHPAPFPLALPAKVLSAVNAQSVLDPFCGSGTTLRAAKNLGLQAVGIEIEERFCEMAAQRLRQEVLFAADAAPAMACV